MTIVLIITSCGWENAVCEKVCTVRHDDRFDLYDDHHTSCGWEKAVCEMGTTMCVSLPDEMKHFSTSGQGDGVLIKTVVESQES